MKYRSKFIIVLWCFIQMGSLGAMNQILESNTQVLSLKKMSTTQLGLEADAKRLMNSLEKLNGDLASEVLAIALNSNTSITPVSKCELISTFQTREDVSDELKQKLAVIEKEILAGHHRLE